METVSTQLQASKAKQCSGKANPAEEREFLRDKKDRMDGCLTCSRDEMARKRQDR